MNGDWVVLVNNNGAVSWVRFHGRGSAEAAHMWLRDKLDDVIIIHDPDPGIAALRMMVDAQAFASFPGYLGPSKPKE